MTRLLALLACALVAVPVSLAAPRTGHLDLYVTLDPESRRFHATAELTTSGNFGFTLHHTLAVLATSVDGKPVAVVSGRRDGQMRDWQVTAPQGAKLRIDYGGVLPALDATLDHRGVLGAMPPMAAREGSYLPAASGWYPRPAAHFSYRVKLALPGDQRGLVAGRLVAEELPRDSAEHYIATFEFEHPADGIDLMAGPYTVREKLVPRGAAAPLRLRTYFYRDLDALADGYLEDSRRYLELYAEQIGAYPFSEFSVVASPLPTGFGMPTLTYIGREVLKLPFIRATSLGHEVLHNWWGNGVYADYTQGNWSEGLTTFMADYFYKERESRAAAREMRLSWLRDFAAVPAGSHRPLAAFRSRTHGAEAAVGYGKSAMVFVMLRDAIGEDVFRRGLRLFWERHRFKLASWDDLRAAFEQAAGRSLKPFFEQWVQRSGGPTVRIVEAKALIENGKNKLALMLTQTAPPYVVTVPVEIIASDGSQTRQIAFDRERDIATIELDAVPEGIRLDPELRLWRVLDREELPPILRQWMIARAPRVAVVSPGAEIRLAAETLAKRFFEMPAKISSPAEATGGAGPALVVGLHRDVDAVLSNLGLPLRPAKIGVRGSAQVWTVDDARNGRRTGAPLAIVSVSDVESLEALVRPVPHYGAQSYLVLDGGRVIERGIWPAPGRVVRVTR
ncbi:MAG: M1 family aminopeptidase [Pseudomonadota bacterium]